MLKNEHQERKHVFSRRDVHLGDIDSHVARISEEFRNGFDFLKKYPRSVTIFGSSAATPDNPNYKKAEELAGRVVRELGYAVITGGGPGIMEAANKGACESSESPNAAGRTGAEGICNIQGVSAGLTISLPHEHNVNKYAGNSYKFSYFFSRKAMLIFAAEAYVFFPGGFGTLDELMGILTLIQTDKIPKVPVILYDSQFWNSFRSFMQDTLHDSYHTIDKRDLELFEITDSLDRIMEVVRSAPIFEWWRNIN